MDRLRDWLAECLPWMQFPRERRQGHGHTRPESVPLTLRVGLVLFFIWTIFVCCILLGGFAVIAYSVFFENS